MPKYVDYGSPTKIIDLHKKKKNNERESFYGQVTSPENAYIVVLKRYLFFLERK